MGFKTVFKRYEYKYLISSKQKNRIIKAIEPYILPDKYGHTTIRNIYFDTDNYRLIRCSIEKPCYKEKLRIRSYCKATKDDTVFVELKKKYKSVVYKRRVSLSEGDAMNWIVEGSENIKNTQICDEINYFIDFYKTLHPTIFLSYERDAFYCRNIPDFRITFDENILCRQYDLTLQSEPYGDAILKPDMVIMEIKCSGGIPLWMTKILSEEHIYKTSFSKYGTAYKTLIFPKLYSKF